MNKGLVVFTIILLVLTIGLLIGFLCISISGGRSIGEFFNGFSISANNDAEKVIDKTFEIEDFDDVDINLDAANVEVVESTDNIVRVEIYAKDSEDYTVEVADRKLRVIEKQLRKNKISFDFSNRKAIVSLPKGFKNKMSIYTDAGDVKVVSFEESDVTIETDAGNIQLGKVNNSRIKTDAGNVKVEETKASDIVTDAGNVSVGKVTESIKIKVDAGNVTIEDADLKADSSIETDFGNIHVNKIYDLNVEAKTDAGKVNVENSNRKADVTLKIISDCGNIEVK